MPMDSSILRRLSESQKIRLLTDLRGLAEPEFTHIGVPRVVSAPLDGGDIFPAPTVMARSFDSGLVRRVSAARAADLVAAGVNHVSVTGAAAVGTAHGALSEDPYLAATIAGAALIGTADVGIAAALDGYGLHLDSSWNDDPLSSGAREIFLNAPFRLALEAAPGTGIICEDGDALPALSADGPVPIFRRMLGETDTVSAIAQGCIAYTASPEALQGALDQYRRLAAAIQHGQATLGDLEAAVAAGTALSEACLDDAVTRLLTFAADCTTCPLAAPAPIDRDALAREAAAATTVLLENRNCTLPLTHRGKRTICLIGDILAEPEGATARLTAAGRSCLGFARGYDLAAERSEAHEAEALALAGKADTILLFLGRPHGQLRRTIPAGQIALYEKLRRIGKPLIVVISADWDLDVGFITMKPTRPAALLLAPLGVMGGVQNVMDILLGKAAPAGHLTGSLHAAGDPATDRSGLLIGPFVGYRYWDTVGFGAAYPFGHGLTYTDFQFSGLSVADGMIRFTVKNTGRRAGVAIPQVYLGMAEATHLRPKKELIGYVTVALKAGEHRTVTIPWRDISVWDEASGQPLVERGCYTVSVGTSVADIRLTRTVMAGDTAVPSAAVISTTEAVRYLAPVSNISTDHYTLEAEIPPMKSSQRNPIAGIVALVLAVSVKIYDIVTLSDAIFLDILAGILAMAGIIFFATEIRDRKRQAAREREELEAANRRLFSEADTLPVHSADALFSLADGLQNLPAIADEESGEHDADFFADVDRELTYPEAIRELMTLALERGVNLDATTARSILAAMASSRMILTRGMNSAQLEALVALLGEYFATPTGVDVVDEHYIRESDVLYAANGIGTRHVRTVIDAAQKNRHQIHIAGLDGVTLEEMSSYIVPFARYARTPHGAESFAVKDDRGHTVHCHIPENVWFILNLRGGESLALLPDYMAEVATVHTWLLPLGTPSDTRTPHRPFSYGQMLYLSDKATAALSLEEELWKRIDRLEAYVARYAADFSMSNKLWLGLEMYVAVALMAADDLSADLALDEALAVKLLPALIPALSGRLPREERTLGETLDVLLGEEHTLACHRVLKDAGTDLA